MKMLSHGLVMAACCKRAAVSVPSGLALEVPCHQSLLMCSKLAFYSLLSFVHDFTLATCSRCMLTTVTFTSHCHFCQPLRSWTSQLFAGQHRPWSNHVLNAPRV